MMRSQYAPDNLNALHSPGDPLVLGLLNRPTVYAPSDVEQGAGDDTVREVVGTIRDVYDVVRNADHAGLMPTVVDDETSQSMDCEISLSNLFLHPVTAFECILGRTLFGVLAIVFIGVGIWAFFQSEG